MSSSILKERIRQHILTQYLAGQGADELDGETALLELNIIDSASVFDLARFLSDEAAVNVPLEHVNADNFSTIDNMVRLVMRLRGD